MNSDDKYTRLGNDYHWRWAKSPANPYRRWVEKVLGYLPEDGQGYVVLDVGSGDGYPASLLDARNYTVWGVEPLPGPRAVAEERVPEASFAEGYPEYTADYVLALDSIEHMTDPAPLVQAVQFCERFALISTPPTTDAYGERQYGPEEIQELFTGCEVEVLHVDTVHQLFKVTPCE